MLHEAVKIKRKFPIFIEENIVNVCVLCKHTLLQSQINQTNVIRFLLFFVKLLKKLIFPNYCRTLQKNVNNENRSIKIKNQ